MLLVSDDEVQLSLQSDKCLALWTPLKSFKLEDMGKSVNFYVGQCCSTYLEISCLSISEGHQEKP